MSHSNYPANPDSIIVKNKFYKGLTSLAVWNHYQLFRSRILDATRGRDLMFAVMYELNKPVLLRNRGGGPIQLTNSNYDNMVTARTLVIYSTMRAYEDIAIIDIDAPDFNKAKEMTEEVYDAMLKSPISNNITIRYTGKIGFHIILKLRRKFKIDDIRFMLEDYLNKANLGYDIGHMRRGNNPLIDLSPNKFRGAFITSGSLSVWGLKSMIVPLNKLSLFTQHHARIKE